jgi:hypothetical protein
MSILFEGSRTQVPSARLKFHNATEGQQLLHINNTVGGINDDVTIAMWFKLTGPVPSTLDNDYKQNFLLGGHVSNAVSFYSPVILLHYGSTSYSSGAPTGGMRFFYDRCMSNPGMPGFYFWASLYSSIVYPKANEWNLIVVRITPNNVDVGSNVGKIFLNGVDITGGQTTKSYTWGGSTITHAHLGGHTMGETVDLQYNGYYYNRFQGLISDFAVWAGAYWDTAGADMFNMYNSKQRFTTFYPDKLKLHFIAKSLTDLTGYTLFDSGFPIELVNVRTDGTGGLDLVNSDEPYYNDFYFLENPLNVFSLISSFFNNNVFYGFGID